MKATFISQLLFWARTEQGRDNNVSSVQAFDPRPLQENYSATRSAVEMLSLGQAGYLSEYGIRVVVFEPGATRTSIIGSSALGTRKVTGDAAEPDFRTQMNKSGKVRVSAIYVDPTGNIQREKVIEKHQRLLYEFGE